jgi:hypothetical protein
MHLHDYVVFKNEDAKNHEDIYIVIIPGEQRVIMNEISFVVLSLLHCR